LAQLRGNRESLHALALEDHTGTKKAPSPLRFAGAVQNTGLMTRQPKLLWSSPCHRINEEALLALNINLFRNGLSLEETKNAATIHIYMA
jgi:hypothetical protein